MAGGSRSQTGAVASAGSEPVRQRRDFSALEARRMRAAEMFRRGARQADVVRELGVSRETASQWYARWSSGGKRALRGAGRAGRLPRLDDKDLDRVQRALRKGPLANGFPTELWTLARVADVIESVTGVAYHPGHVWRILGQMGWSRQRPARRAVERDDEAIATWVADRWPKVKKTPDGGAPGSSSRTSRGSRSSRS